MSSFRVYGLDELIVQLEQLAGMDDESKWTILQRGGEVLRAAHQRHLDAFHHLTGQLEASLTISQKQAGEELVALVAPKGKRKGAFTGKRRKKDRSGRRRSSGHYEGTNAEVAYYLEYGTPRMPAAHWMETANEEAMAEVQAAMEQAFDEFLESKGF